jgi:transposase
MHDRELFFKLLGLEAPWGVERVELDLNGQQVDVWLVHGEHRWRCGVCNEVCPLYDHGEERRWRHLDTMQYRTVIHARPPRIECQEHGVRQVQLPWSEPLGRFTLLFERFAIEVLKAMGVSGAQRVLGLSWDEAWAIERRAVERGLERKQKQLPQFMGIDEKAFAKGQDAYMTIVCDLQAATVEWIGQDRREQSVTEYLERFSEEERSQIEAIAMDMWRAYARAVRLWVPGALDKIVYDRFHAMQELTEAVDRVRKRENRALVAEQDERLKGTKYMWLWSRERLPRKYRRHFAMLKRAGLKTGRAWAIKEALRHLWEFQTRPRAEAFWKRWYFWATHSRLVPVMLAAQKLRRHVRELLNYFDHRVTNAQAEALNGRIERLKRISHGFRNRDNFKTAIFFHCGGLDLSPATH